MNTIKLTLTPDQAVPQFKRLRFDVIDRPLRDVLLLGLHPVGLARGYASSNDSSRLVDAVLSRLNEEKNLIAQLREFRHSEPIAAPAKTQFSSHGYAADKTKDDALEALKWVAAARPPATHAAACLINSVL